MQNIFEIENLQCAYGKKEEMKYRVLDIEKLCIPQGKMLFFVGPSGIGKSTILEVLGFMNDTIVKVDKFLYKNKDVTDAWLWSDEELSEFRNKEFSFIFQNNNLMPNFSAYENIMITAMFQGASYSDAQVKAKQIMQILGLPSEDREIRRYSGGQRQRLAFARAIMPEFSVIFGDEPTGNLDEGSAINVMKILHERVHTQNVTAIIVSHDMRLATQYADVIVQIQRTPRGKGEDGTPNYYGKINENSIFIKENDVWTQKEKTFTKEEFLRKLEGDLTYEEK